MKISIFPDAKPHPKNKDEKVAEAKKFSSPYLPKSVDIANDEQLMGFVTKYAWSPFIFDGVRKEENFVSCDFLVYDIDEGMTIDECAEIIEKNKLCCLCLPSPSHTPEAQRFRIIMPLARTITDLSVYGETWDKGAAIFGVVDEQCKDGCRGYFACTDSDGFWQNGDLFAPILPQFKDTTGTAPSQTYMINVTEDLDELVTQIYGEKREKIPEAVDFFLRNVKSGLPGKWMNSLNSFCFSLSLSGVEDCAIMELCEQLAPEPLDSKDKYQIKRAIRDGKKAAKV
jgi:hypothetical protein